MVEVTVASADDTKVLALMQARHRHDCECCKFLGYADYPQHIEYSRLDAYFCGEEDGGTLILRHGSDGPEYISFPVTSARVIARQMERAFEWRAGIALYDAWRNSPETYVSKDEWRGIALMTAADTLAIALEQGE
jgi:hypothetical protein